MCKFTSSSKRIIYLQPFRSSAAVLPEIALFFQVSEDDSYPSDVSDNISMDNFSNGTESDRQNTGIFSHF